MGMSTRTVEYVFVTWLIVSLCTGYAGLPPDTPHSLPFLAAPMVECMLLTASLWFPAPTPMIVHHLRTLLPIVHITSLCVDDDETVLALLDSLVELNRGFLVLPPPLLLGILHGMQPVSLRHRLALVSTSIVLLLIIPAFAMVLRALELPDEWFGARTLVNLVLGFVASAVTVGTAAAEDQPIKVRSAFDPAMVATLSAADLAHSRAQQMRSLAAFTVRQRHAHMHAQEEAMAAAAAHAATRGMGSEVRDAACSDLAAGGDGLAVAATATASTIASTCSVCLDAEATFALMPCGHRCLCRMCAANPLLGRLCPLCRRPAEHVARIYI